MKAFPAAILLFLLLLFSSTELLAFGSIAIDERGRREAMVVNYPSQHRADDAALDECGNRHCRVVGRFANSCGAIAWSNRDDAWIWSDGFHSEGAAARAAEHRCREQTGHHCRVRALCDEGSHRHRDEWRR
ncbi:MAG: DUF4189 domain-containing protein [Magnetococcales bacterium]|nr:DUF4189 domain-containing protein [Magnetococcales bacterium]